MIGLGLRAQRGGAVAVAISIKGGAPSLALSTILLTHEADDRLALEPYHAARDLAHDRDAAEAAVIQGRARQGEAATESLQAILATLRTAGSEPIVAGLLVNRAGWVTDLLDYSLAFAEHAAVAEGLAVRDALRSALNSAHISTQELDEKSLMALASERLALSQEDIDAQLKALGTQAGKPWRKEQKSACLAALVAASSAE